MKQSIFILSNIVFVSFAYLIIDFFAGIDPNLVITYGLTMAFTVIAAVILFCKVKSGWDLFEIFLWSSGYFLLILLIRAIVIIFSDSIYLGKMPFDDRTLNAFNLALAYSMLAFIVFFIAYNSRLAIRISISLFDLPLRWSIYKARNLSLLLFVAGISLKILLILRLGGFSYYVLNKQEITTVAITGNHYLVLGGTLANYALFITYFIWCKSNRYAFLTWGVFFPVILAFSVLSGSKGSFLAVIIPLLVIYHYTKKRVSLKKVIVVSSLIFLTFPIFNASRGNFYYLEDLKDNIQVVSKETIENTKLFFYHSFRRFTGIDSLAIIIRDTPGGMDFQYGRTMLTVFLAPIPRNIWEDKPVVSFGKIFAVQYLGSNSEFAAPTIIGEGYINFHIFGIIICSFVVGLISKITYHYCILKRSGDSSIFLYSVVFSSLINVWEWNIPGWVTNIIPKVFIACVICILLKRKAK